MDALKLLTSDHRAAQTLFDRYEDAATPGEGRYLVHALADHLTRHTVVEKHMLYPLLARVILGPGVSVPSPRRDVCDGMEYVLAVLPQTASHDSRATARLMATLHRDFTLHRNFDEKHLHPLLHRVLDQSAREELGQLLVEAKDIAPGFSNTVRVEAQPTSLTIALRAFCDRLRDRLGDRSPV